MKNLIKNFIFLIAILCLFSCELYYGKQPKGRIILVSIGVNYTDENGGYFKSSNTFPDDLNFLSLEGTLNDVKMSAAALETLSKKAGKDFYWIPLLQDGTKNSESLNFATKENLFSTLDYLESSNGINETPLIIKNPSYYDLNDSFNNYNGSSEIYTGNLILNTNDILIVYYSGHGFGHSSLLKDTRTGDICLLTKEDDKFVVDNVPTEDLFKSFDNLNCKTLLILDSCYSGNNIQTSTSTISHDDLQYDSISFFDKVSLLLSSESVEYNKIFVLSASQANEETYEKDDSGKKNNGAFTTFLLKSLGWNLEEDNISSIGSFSKYIPAEKNEELSVDDIYRYTKDLYNISSNKNTPGFLYNPRVEGGRQDLVLFQFNKKL